MNDRCAPRQASFKPGVKPRTQKHRCLREPTDHWRRALCTPQEGTECRKQKQAAISTRGRLLGDDKKSPLKFKMPKTQGGHTRYGGKANGGGKPPHSACFFKQSTNSSIASQACQGHGVVAVIATVRMTAVTQSTGQNILNQRVYPGGQRACRGVLLG